MSVQTNATAVLPERGARWPTLVRIVGPLAILLGFAYALTAVTMTAPISDELPAPPPTPIWIMLGFWLSLPGLTALVLTGATWGLGKVSDQRVPYAEVLAAYLMASLWHVLAAIWIYYQLAVQQVYQSEVMTLNLNLLDWGGLPGRLLWRVTLDELLHVGTYAYLVARLYRVKSPTWIFVVLYLLMLAFTAVTLPRV